MAIKCNERTVHVTKVMVGWGTRIKTLVKHAVKVKSQLRATGL